MSAARASHSERSEQDRTGSGRPLVADLLALRELQASLGLEESDEAVVRVGANAIVEILTLDGGIAFIDPSAGRPEIRLGWRHGRAMSQHDIDSLARALERELVDVRRGRTGNLLLSAKGGGRTPQAQLPQAAKAFGFASVLIIGLGSGGRRTGALILASRDEEAFNGEQMILAEILASQVSEQCERVRMVAESESFEARVRAAVDQATKGVVARNAELEAQAAIASAASLSFDTERQIDLALKKALELTRHRAGAIYLVESNEAGDDLLRFAKGEGKASWLELARLPRWRRGEGLAGRVWDRSEAAFFGDLSDDPTGFGAEALHKAGYRRLCCAPLQARGRTIGVVQLFGDESKPYEETERGLLRAIADQVGIAIQNARLLADVMHNSLDLEWRVERMGSESERGAKARRGLVELVSAAAGGPGLDERSVEMLRRGVELTGADAAALFAWNDKVGRLRRVAQHGFPETAWGNEKELPADDAVLARALIAPGGAADPGASPDDARPAPGTVLDLAAEEIVMRAGWIRRAGYRHALVLPCRAGGTTRGVLLVAARYAGSLGEETQAALGPIAGLFGLILTPGTDGRGADAAAAAGATSGAGDNTSGHDRSGDAAGANLLPRRHELLVHAQKMESIGTLAPEFAHEFNNNLGAIMGHASHIRSLVPDHNPVHGKAAVIVEQSKRTADLVRQLVTFSRGGVGRKVRVRIATLVNETIAFLTRVLGPSINIEARCSADLPCVEVDPGQIRQALLNLAVNARDAMPEGGLMIFEGRAGHIDAQAASAMPELAPGDYVSIVVRDSGAGMPPEVMEHAFDPFYTTKPSAEATGLGLTVVQDILREHGGHVSLSSSPQVGTAVRLYLPVCHRAPLPGEDPDGARLSDEPEPAPLELSDIAGDHVAAGDTGRMETGRDGRGDVLADTLGRADRSLAPPPLGWSDAGEDGDKEQSITDLFREAASTLELRSSGPSDAISAPHLKVQVPDTGGRPARILVVDDEPILRDMIADMLRSRGYEVVLAKDGVEALEIYREEWGKIGLVMLDMIMPRLGGLETCRRLFGMDRAARVLLCSGFSDGQQVQLAIKEGACGLLPKPFGMAELFGWVERALRPRSLSE